MKINKLKILVLLILIIFIIIMFYLISVYKISHFANYGINTDKPTIIVGSSEYLMTKIDDLKRLKKTGKYQFIAHQSGFHFFLDHLGFYPDYVIFLDPFTYPISLWIFRDEYDYREKIINEKIPTKIIFYESLWNKIMNNSWNDLRYKDKDSRGWRTPAIHCGKNDEEKKKTWDNYTEFLKNHKSHIIILPSIENIDCNNYKIDNKDSVIINSNFCVYNKKKKSFAKSSKLITKLEHHILNLIDFLNFKQIYLIGFDSKGKRFPCEYFSNTISKYYGFNPASGVFSYNSDILIPYKYLFKKSNIKNLIEDENTNLKGMIPYKNIKELK
jgi:hypothetical protein